jgi:hypothetical protein
VVAAANRSILDLDCVVLRHKPELLEQRQIALGEVGEVLSRIWCNHGSTVAAAINRYDRCDGVPVYTDCHSAVLHIRGCSDRLFHRRWVTGLRWGIESLHGGAFHNPWGHHDRLQPPHNDDR